MSKSLEHVWDRFFVAVSTLATGPGSIQQRLADAYIHGLIRLKPEDLPTELQGEFRAVVDALTREEPKRSEGPILARTRAMSADEAGRLAEKILVIYDGIARRDPSDEYH